MEKSALISFFVQTKIVHIAQAAHLIFRYGSLFDRKIGGSVTGLCGYSPPSLPQQVKILKNVQILCKCSSPQKNF